MTYLSLSLWFIGAAALIAVLLPLCGGGRRSARPNLTAVALTLLALIILTAVFDSLMIAADLFYYAPEMLVGVHIGLAPIEDFAYPVAGGILLPSLWALLRSRRRSTEPVSKTS
ncbi:lycopene cyclase domain-containing protein [Nesterenkonia flava]|uniref:Lycopene cyclase domain-containing protein n=1 Tax=Nesterenkonia flava TaxID=469799 RepID=A0ABU1FS55_9MICC|nr:lycopene cyclase domain-containing protein [Nesterenkonia flava]MDR5711500.1 lycopene cyclase domain-containing protein [Nesterenkonia flava]